MIENCLRHKIIRDFLKHYTENRWKDLIPSLIEIGILNLQNSFNKIIFTNDELKKFSRHLQISQIEKDKERSKESFKENKDNKEKDNEKSIDIKNDSKEKQEEKVDRNKLIKSQSKTNETPKNMNGGNINNANNNIQRMKMIDIVQNNPEKQEKMKSCTEAIIEMKNNIKNNYQYFKNNISIDFKNKLTKQKGEYYKKINIEKNRINTKKHIDKISYAISYDKDLRPASISKKINNTQNNINNRNNKAEYNNINYKFIQNYSSEKKSNNNSKSKSKSKKYKNNEKYMNINLNNLNRINNVHNVKRKHYNVNRANNKNEIVRTTGNEKNNYYKKLSIMQSHNLANNDTNNNYHVVKVDRPQINKMKVRKNTLNNISNSYNNNYRNINFINTLYQRVNSNGQAIKINSDNYFSNREELNEFIRKNRIRLNVKQEMNKGKNLTKSEKPSDRKNNFLNLDDKDKIKEKEIFSDGRNSKNNVQNKTNKKNSNILFSNKNEIENKNELIRSYPNNKDFMKLNKKNSKTPKNTISTEKERDTISISNSKNKINDIGDKTNIKKNNDISEEKKVEQKKIENKNEINTGLKTIKLFDLNKDKNSEKKLFEKAKGKNADRYFNIFGYEQEEISLTQIEKDYSGIIDSSTSNEIQMNPDYFFKETPRNVFKINKSSEHSINSNNNEG